MSRQPMKNLLIDPSWRMVVSDHGHDWVTDRFSLARGDLFTRTPTANAEYALSRRALRASLALARGEAFPVSQTGVVFRPDWRKDNALLCSTAGGLIAVHERVFRGFLATGATPRYVPASRTVGWWLGVRGKSALVGLTMTVVLNRISAGDFVEATA